MIALRTDLFPVVYAFAWGELTHEDIGSLREVYERLHSDAPSRFVQIYDARGAQLPTATVRQGLGELSKEFDERVKKNIVVNTVVIGSKVFAGALTAIQWLSDGTLAVRYFASAVEALAHCREKAAAEGLELPAAVGDLARRLDDAHRNDRDPASFRVDRYTL